jgi:CIC family chloride channel protein
LGALIGAAYGIAATSVFPALSSGETAYALIGMGAMAAAVLGAPISTTLIIFEFTGDYELTIGVVVAVVIATGVVQRLIGRESFFHWQLARRGLRVRASVDAIRPPAVPLSDLPCHPCPRVPEDAPWEEVAHAMRTAPGGQVYTVNGDGAVRGVITASDLESRLGGRGSVSALDLARPDPPVVTPTDSLDQALALLAEEGGETLALVEDREGRRILGIVREADLLRAHNRSLIEAFAGDHLGGR